MRRRVLLCFVLALASGCQGDDATKPKVTSAPPPPSRIISDGNHSGNPDFFFLPPMVSDPSSGPNWDAGAFNGALSPKVAICELPGTDPTAITASTTCGASAPVGTPVVDVANEQYQVNWQVPNSTTTFYRITVKVGDISLGYADVQTASNMSSLKNVKTGEMIPLADGRTLPIKFRIERYALCTVPGQGPCTSAAVDLSAGGTVQTVLDPVNAPQPSGISIPQGAGTGTVNITVQTCPDFNPRATDLPTFGGCVRVTAQPSLPASGFAAPVTVFNCNVSDKTLPIDDPSTNLVGKVTSHAQADRITLHQLDEVNGQYVLVALPHTAACGTTPVVGSVRGVLDDLRHGKLKSATEQMIAMIAPKPLYASMFIDLGGGGQIDAGSGLSDFQFLLPAKFTVDPSTDNAFLGPNEAATPAVIVSDLGDEPVRGATVNFIPAAGTVSLNSAVTGADGRASTVWTPSASAGTYTLVASGRGIAGTDFNGPRRTAGSEFDDIVDPFQPIQTLYNPSPLDQPVTVLTGSVQLHATSLSTPIGGFGFGSDGFLYEPIGLDATPPDGFFAPSFAPSGWTLATAPFGSGGCAAPVTYWRTYSGILARKSFSTRTAAILQVHVQIDNDIRLWVDGKEITSSGTAADQSYFNAQTGWWIHDQCVLYNPPTFTANVGPGNHVLAVWATDRGGDSHFDVSVSPTQLLQ